jgi:hypothetical protein
MLSSSAQATRTSGSAQNQKFLLDQADSLSQLATPSCPLRLRLMRLPDGRQAPLTVASTFGQMHPAPFRLVTSAFVVTNQFVDAGLKISRRILFSNH